MWAVVGGVVIPDGVGAGGPDVVDFDACNEAMGRGGVEEGRKGGEEEGGGGEHIDRGLEERKGL